jgi:hypothetical protein
MTPCRASIAGQPLLGGRSGIAAKPTVVNEQRRDASRLQVRGNRRAHRTISGVPGKDDDRHTRPRPGGRCEPRIEREPVVGRELNLLGGKSGL